MNHEKTEKMGHANSGILNLEAAKTTRSVLESGECHIVDLPAWCGDSVLLIPYNWKVHSNDAATALNFNHEGFLRMLENGLMKYEKTGNGALINSSDFMQYKEKIDLQQKDSIERLATIDSPDDYFTPAELKNR